MTKTAKWVFLLMVGLALVYNFFLPLAPDEAYYWAWSRHLALSYYDGPPLIAYLIRMSTGLLGENAFAVKCVGVFCFTGAAYLLHQLAKHLFGVKTAEIALILFLLSPGVQVGYAITTYDAPLTLFWIATLYVFYLAVETKRTRYFYGTGICVGLLFLSKYTGFLLLPCLIVWLPFRNKHVYGGILLAFLIFSPVLIWNMQENWASFLFQWHHGVATEQVFQWHFLGLFLAGQMALITPIVFVALLILIPLKWREIWQNPKLRYLLLPFLGTFGFFLYNGLYSHSAVNWPAPAYFSAIILLAHLIQKYHYRKTYIAILAVCLLYLMVLRIPVLTSGVPAARHFFIRLYGYPAMMQQADSVVKQGDLILADSYQTASEASFYLKGQPPVYILGRGRISAYTYWSRVLAKQPLKQAWYIGQNPPSLEDYFHQCEFVQNLEYQGSMGSKQLVLYYCSSLGNLTINSADSPSTE